MSEPQKLNLPFTTKTEHLEFYEKKVLATTQPPKTNPRQQAYLNLTQEQKQAISDGENMVFEVTRRAKILLEKEQRETEQTEKTANKPFLPTQEQIIAKLKQTITPEETAKIEMARSAVTEWVASTNIIKEAEAKVDESR